MSTNVTYVANVYRVPAYQDTGYAQGSGNLSSYLIALATGSLTLSGGTFTLTADADFGANFGLKSIYYKSRATNPASTGVIRLGSTEALSWRNNANGADLALTTDTSDRLTYNGVVIATSGGIIELPNGTAGAPSLTFASDTNTGIYRQGTHALGITTNGTLALYLDTNQNVFVTGGISLAATTNQIALSTGANQTVISAPTPAATRTYTFPDAGAAAHIVLDQGNYTIAGTWTYSAAVTITPTTNQLILGTTRTVTISATQPAVTSRVYTIPDAGAAASFVLTQGAQTIAGVTTFSSAIPITATSNHLVLSTATNTLTINANTQATARIWSIPDISGAGTFAALEGTQTFSGSKTFSSSLTTAAIVASGDITTTGNLYGTATFNTLTGAYVGDAPTIAITNSKTMTVTVGNGAKIFAIYLSSGDSAFVVANFVATTITITGTNGSIVASNAPSSSQLGIFKSGSSQVVSFIAGSALTSTATTVQIFSLGGRITAITNWA